MERVSGLYKQNIQRMVFAIALFIAVAANIDTGAITKHISKSQFLHDLLAAKASSISQPADSEGSAHTVPATPQPTPGALYDATPTPNAFTPSSNTGASPRTVVVPSPSASPGRDSLSSSSELGPRKSEVQILNEEANKLALPIGWSGDFQFRNPVNLFTSIVGWLITALATTLCALSWFDIRNKFIVVRSTIKPQDGNLREPSQTRRPDVQ